MYKTSENIKLAKSMILSSTLLGGIAYGANTQTAREFSKMQPIVENKMEIIAPQNKDFFVTGISIDDIDKNSIRFEIPIPSMATIEAKNIIATKFDKYTSMEINLKQTINYRNFRITLISVRYNSNKISSTFVIIAGEEEWKIKTYPNKKETIDYIDHDNERAWRLNFLVEQIKSPNTVTIKLMEERISAKEINRSEKK